MRPLSNSRQWQTYFTGSENTVNNKNSSLKSSSNSAKNKAKFKPSFYSTILCMLYIKKIKKSIKKRKHRQQILKNWYDTQCTYNLDLYVSMNCIRKPMQQAGMIDKDQSQILFPQIQGMLQLSNMMLSVVKKCQQIKNPNKILLGKEVNQFSSGFKLYGGYFGKVLKSSQLLAQLAQRKQEQLKNIQKNMQAQYVKKQSSKEGVSIQDCMQQPMYRIFKYVLLLQDYIKRLPKYHPDYDSIKACHKSFKDINNFNNQLMKKIEDQQKKIKLDKLFGEALKQNRFLIAEMKASTIQFEAKLYIFNDLIIVSKVQNLLGSIRQQKFGSFQLNQFGYVAQQDNLKYFKFILILITKEQCIHFFFPDQGSRLQLFKCMQKNLRQLKIKEYQRRKMGDAQKNIKVKKIMFTLQQQQKNEVFLLQPQFRVQIVGFQVRPLSTLTNDTVYITRFMIPEYFEDQLTFLNSEGQKLALNRDSKTISRQNANFIQKYNSLPFNVNQSADQHLNKNFRENTYKCINQKIEIHFSVLEQIYQQMKRICPDKVPDIDPITKDVNIYAKGKRKTKSFETRKFFIQQFLNFVFRHQIIMRNPISLISKLRINQDLWNYSTIRNSQLKTQSKQNDANFGYDHCAICKKGKITQIQQFQHFRSYYLSSTDHRANKQPDRYCFNFFSLIRVRLLSFNYISFNTLERILLFYHYLQGRIDYPFTIHRCKDKLVKIIKIYLPSLDDNFVSVTIDSQSTVGEVLDQLGNVYKMKSSFDYDLMVNYAGKNRLLGRDEFLIDVLKCLNIQYNECSSDKTQVTKINTQKGFFDNLKSWKNQLFNSSTEEEKKIYFIKSTYLHRSLQLKSFSFYPEKKQVEIQKIFWSIKKGLLKLTFNQFIQVGALYYCLRELDTIQNFTIFKMSFKTLEKIAPNQHLYSLNNEQRFKTQIGKCIESQKLILIKNNKDTSYIHTKIIELVSQKLDYITYFLEVEPKQIPQNLLPKNQMPSSCLIGVNYKNIIITKNAQDTTPLITLPIQQIQFYLSVFSIFVSHQTLNFRFDGRMLYHFKQLVKKYQIIAKKFPQ